MLSACGGEPVATTRGDETGAAEGAAEGAAARPMKLKKPIVRVQALRAGAERLSGRGQLWVRHYHDAPRTLSPSIADVIGE